MSDPATITPTSTPAEPVAKSFVAHAKLIGGLTLISRFMGLARDVVAVHFFGTGLVASAFTVAFLIPNLFRKLLGEGALSAAFIPLYAQAVKRGHAESGEPANEFAANSVNLLCAILLGITIVGEIIIAACLHWGPQDHADRLLMLRFTAIMLPYVLLVCGGAFLSGILQVHKRFGPPAFAPVILNAVHILVVVCGAWLLSLHGKDEQTPRVIALQTKLAYALTFAVIVAGMMQVAILWPSLRKIGFRFRPTVNFWTPSVRKMMLLSLPVAMGAGVLQLSVMLDKGISYALMQGVDSAGNFITHFQFFGHTVRYPMEAGAIRRLDLAQVLYQFPLGVFAIALATAIFPGLSSDALDKDRGKFRTVLRQGIEATLWEGLPASIGLILVREPAIRLLFQHGQIREHDAALIGNSLLFYAGAIWAFSLLQIVNRAYYAVHDMTTPLVMSIVNIVLNLAVELPLLWTGLGESAMAVGTLVSFSIQAVFMIWLLDRRLGGIGLRQSLAPVIKMLIATAVMTCACLLVKHSPLYPAGTGRVIWATQLTMLLVTGAGVYLALCAVMGIDMLAQLRPKRKTRMTKPESPNQ